MRDITGLVRKATSQHGLLSTSDLRDLGFSPAAERTLVRRGVVERMRPGVVRLAGPAATYTQRLAAVTLSTTAVASHISALRLHGWRDRAVRIEVSVSYPADCHLADVTVHRSRTLDHGQITTVDGINTTTLARTLIDLAGRLSGRELGRIIDHAMSVGGLQVDDLVALRRTVGVGRRGITRLDAVLAAQAGVCSAGSGPEVDLARLLIEADLPGPVPQFPVEIDGFRYLIDLAYPDALVAIEYDGFAAHSGHQQFENDRRRQNHLVRAGWRVLRFTARDLREDRVGVVALVRAELARGRG